ncbi:MAG: flagellar FliJ family protein [Acidobacteria bacterium]|nr:flagellar FliJ family protein [Acidobacteriota bacterium]
MFRQSSLDQKLIELENALAEARALEERHAALTREERQATTAVRSLSVVPVQELLALESFRHWTEKELQKLQRDARQLEEKIQQRREAVVAAQIEVESLTTLRERRLDAWRSEVDRETEATVAELVVARWGRKDS